MRGRPIAGWAAALPRRRLRRQRGLRPVPRRRANDAGERGRRRAAGMDRARCRDQLRGDRQPVCRTRRSSRARCRRWCRPACSATTRPKPRTQVNARRARRSRLGSRPASSAATTRASTAQRAPDLGAVGTRDEQVASLAHAARDAVTAARRRQRRVRARRLGARATAQRERRTRCTRRPTSGKRSRRRSSAPASRSIKPPRSSPSRATSARERARDTTLPPLPHAAAVPVLAGRRRSTRCPSTCPRTSRGSARTAARTRAWT